MRMVDRWEPEAVARYLVRLSAGEQVVVWVPTAGLVYVRCVRAELAWEFTPVRGTWKWLKVATDGAEERLLAVTYHDGAAEPRCLHTTPCGAESALWDAVDLLECELWDAEAAAT